MKKYLIGLYLVLIPIISMAALPITQIENNIQFIEGGVGADESEAIEKNLINWPLLLEFSQKNGAAAEWISGVLLVVKNDAGVEVLSHRVDGPMILLGLNPGKYNIEATYGNQLKRVGFTTGNNRHKKMILMWGFN